MASIKQCCAVGSLHTGTPTGRIANLHGLECYIADAPNGLPTGVVVIIPDIFGWEFANTRILADCYAKEGNFQVYLPDFMNGTGFPDSLLLSLKAFAATGLWNQLSKVWHAIYVSWYMIPFWRSCRPAAARSRVYNFLRTLKQNEAKDLPMGTAGFCWGGKFVTELCWDQEQNKTEAGTRVTVCGYVAHPSLLEIPGDIDNITLPYSCAAAELDHLMSPDKAKEMQEVLQTKAAKMKDRGVDYGFVTYPGVEHGFAIRADENDTHAAEQGKKAEKQAVEWFERWFSNPPPS